MSNAFTNDSAVPVATRLDDLQARHDQLLQQLNDAQRELTDLRREHEISRLFISAIDQSSESIFFTDIKGRILYVNRSFEENSGYTRDELLGKTPRILKSGQHPQSFYKTMWATLLRGDVYHNRMTNLRKDGTLYHENASIAPVRNADGVITSFVSVKTNITNLLEGQRALEATNRELSRSNAELEQFAYVASHDLQEPLRSVSSCLQLLERRYAGQLDARADEFIAHAVAGCQRMRRLIDNLLALSRVNVDSEELQRTDSADVLAQVLANLAHAIEESGATISHDALPIINAAPHMLAQLFQNLISNAIKFRGNHPPVVKISATHHDDHWLFSVADQGIGIDPSHFERIFRLFQRLHSRDEYPGTGFGLAICQKIVSHHGGRIWVESTPGHGATFFFTLPNNPQPPPPHDHDS